MSIAYFLISWALISTVDAYSAPDRTLATKFSIVAPTEKHPPRRHVAVALSGGGYRAALMHAGVLAALDHYDLNPSAVAAVSGGSIVGAYYVRGGNMTEFVSLASHGQFNVLKKFLNLFYVPSMIRLSTRSAHERILDDRLYGGATLASSQQADSARLMIVVTEIGSGRTLGLTYRGYLARNTLLEIEPKEESPVPRSSPSREIRPQQLADWKRAAPSSWPGSSPISTLVSASSAFPLAFDTLDIEHMQLADGGISDNSGTAVLLDMDYFAQFCREEDVFDGWRDDLVIRSNAGTGFLPTWVPFERFASARRAVDLAYSHVETHSLYSQHALTKNLTPPSIELNPNLLLRSNIQMTESVREIKIDDDFVYSAIRSLTAQERVRLAKWLAAQPDVDEFTKGSMDGFARGDGELSDMLATELTISRGELERDVEEFLKTDAMVTVYTPESAHRIFRLGFWLVSLNIRALESSLHQVRPSPPPLHICPSFR